MGEGVHNCQQDKERSQGKQKVIREGSELTMAHFIIPCNKDGLKQDASDFPAEKNSRI